MFEQAQSDDDRLGDERQQDPTPEQRRDVDGRPREEGVAEGDGEEREVRQVVPARRVHGRAIAPSSLIVSVRQDVYDPPGCRAADL